jgi:hypothetical protein
MKIVAFRILLVADIDLNIVLVKEIDRNTQLRHWKHVVGCSTVSSLVDAGGNVNIQIPTATSNSKDTMPMTQVVIVEEREKESVSQNTEDYFSHQALQPTILE